ncbi:MAG: hypothetical protein M1826_007630 [Phylliscum demangeonii]|nr:MAG: hypothetical protein M1826_007630 [Phylliscum demangeonii]
MTYKTERSPSKPIFLPEPANKLRRQALHLKRKKANESRKRDERFRRKREEDKDPRLREERRKRCIPQTLETKRVWDQVGLDDEPGLGVSVDLERIKRLRREEKTWQDVEKPASQKGDEAEEEGEDDDGDSQDGVDSMLESSDEEGAEDGDAEMKGADKDGETANWREEKDEKQASAGLVDDDGHPPPDVRPRAPSPAVSATSTKLDLAPAALAAKFPTLFSTETPPVPKILVTTSLSSTLHDEARILTTLFPHSVYIPRSTRRVGYNFSVREIAKFASNRNYTALVVLREDLKKPSGLTVVHLPSGPSFHFSISNWVEGKRLPGHGKPTGHIPELILNNFRTPLGLLTAHLFRSIFPAQPNLQGRQVVTLHNQRDYIFVRRHRYIFRDKRPTEKVVTGPDGNAIKGAEGIRAGLQELGPRFTLKLRRVDPGIGRAGSEGQVEWEWRGSMEKQRTKFQL